MKFFPTFTCSFSSRVPSAWQNSMISASPLLLCATAPNFLAKRCLRCTCSTKGWGRLQSYRFELKSMMGVITTGTGNATPGEIKGNSNTPVLNVAEISHPKSHKYYFPREEGHASWHSKRTKRKLSRRFQWEFVSIKKDIGSISPII